MKLPHETYLEAVEEMRQSIKTQGLEEFLKFIETQNDMDKESMTRLAMYIHTGDYDPDKLMTDFSMAGAYMVKNYNENKVVFQIERELSLALMNSTLSIPAEEIRFPFDSMMVYHGLTYSDIGYPQYDDHNVICTHVVSERKNGSLTVRSGDITKNPESKNKDDQYLNTCYGELVLPDGKTYAPDIMFDERNRYFDKKAEGIISDFIPDFYEDYKKAFFKMRDAINHVAIIITTYLAMDNDIELVYPEWSQSKIDAISNPKKKRRAEKLLRNETDCVIHYVGERYKDAVHKKLRDAGLPIDYKYQIKVAGHFNYYWYGKRRDEFGNKIIGEIRKPVWLKPTIRLPELPERNATQVYKVR